MQIAAVEIAAETSRALTAVMAIRQRIEIIERLCLQKQFKIVISKVTKTVETEVKIPEAIVVMGEIRETTQILGSLVMYRI